MCFFGNLKIQKQGNPQTVKNIHDLEELKTKISPFSSRSATSVTASAILKVLCSFYALQNDRLSLKNSKILPFSTEHVWLNIQRSPFCGHVVGRRRQLRGQRSTTDHTPGSKRSSRQKSCQDVGHLSLAKFVCTFLQNAKQCESM